jgi:hypothetical protein
MNEYSEAEDILHGLTAVLDEAAWRAPPEVVEQRVLDTLAGLSPLEAEGFASALGDVGNFFKSKEVRGFAGAALPVVGTAVGTVYGGPVGAAVGASLGGAAGQAIAGNRRTHGAPPAQPTAPPPATGPALASAPPAAGAPGALATEPQSQRAPAGSTAAAQLLGVIKDPALLSSLLALVLGSSGKSSIPVGNTGAEVPVGAMMNLVGVLANRAAEDAEQILAARQDGTPAYLLDQDGCLTCDPAVPSHRADALLRLLSSGRAGGLEESAICECAECSASRDLDAWL